ncbi:isopenicillin N synthase family dioxygenase [Histidinibacterium lentulum]|uniref:2-oxoglutarate-dependent ethylene/succinate-forming enzyme n=1 Tax=Histidinibacterium lentulum TaxID=2480588 RepID=A0A3N2R627_9RHOB|nr:2-oxoglutarate and iron-dependent oxygenase domain-containing protein [Histidinibacterium lentulum]ROU02919.1 isopenicillin N synthase family oxygenase [Histidinibacterium lentulum]
MTDQKFPKAYEKARDVDISAIPVIDFEGFRDGSESTRAAIAERIAAACETVGFFYLAGHGVPQSLIDDTFGMSATFFAQPFEDRMKTGATLDWWRGYVPSKLEGEGGQVGGAIETFRTMFELAPDDPDVKMGKPMHAPNRWPDHLAGFKDTVTAYQESQLDLSVHLAKAFAMGLDLPEDWFAPYYKRPLVQLSLLHYRPPKSQREEDFEIGAGEHTDTGAFTLLMQDDTGGLEVGHLENEWISAPPIAGTYVINIGDMMMRWTNGRYRSTPHRVVNRSTKPRYSIPFFANPDYDSIIAPPPQLVEPGTPVAFPPLHFGEYMDDFYSKGMAYLRK